jgi:hypothetical protein
MDTITVIELSEITKVHKYTMQNYLSNFRFNKFRLTTREGLYALYEKSYKFLNDLYNCLIYRKKIYQAQRLKNHFKNLNFKLMSYEDYTRC